MDNLGESTPLLGKSETRLSRFLYIMKQSGLIPVVGLSVLFSVVTLDLGYLYLKGYIENYKNAAEGIIERKNIGGGVVRTTDYVCDSVLKLICNERITFTYPPKEEIFRIGGNDKINFGHSKDFSLSEDSLPSEDELRGIISQLKSFLDENPNILSIEIEGKSSPEGLSEKSLNGLDKESYEKNKALSLERANYLKNQLLTQMPEIAPYINSVIGNVSTLNEDDLDRLGQISIKMGFNGNLQEFIKNFNKSEINGLSQEDLNFLNNIFDRSTLIKVRGSKLGLSIITDPRSTTSDFFHLLSLIFIIITGYAYGKLLHIRGLRKIMDDLLKNGISDDEKSCLEEMLFGKKGVEKFRKNNEKFIEIIDSMNEGDIIILNESNSVGLMKYSWGWRFISQKTTPVVFNGKNTEYYHFPDESRSGPRLIRGNYQLFLELSGYRINPDSIKIVGLDELNSLMSKNFKRQSN